MHYRNGIRLERDDPSPPGISLSPGYYMFVEACECCVGRNECPWCGAALEGDTNDLSEQSALRCPTLECGWSWRYALDHADDPIEE